MKNRIIDDDFISSLEAVTMHMQSPMRGYFGGNHKTNAYGNTVEFADFREYVLGDDIRRIDWNLLARFEKHFIKLFVDERQMHIQIFLDCSASMAKADEQKSFHAMRIAAALGYLTVHNMDKLSYRLVHGSVADDRFGIISGKDAYFRATRDLEQAQFKGSADLKTAIISDLSIGSNDGLTVIISDFMNDNNWKKAVDFLIYKKRQVLLIQVLSPEEINPPYNGRLRLVDTESADPLDERNMKMRITRSDIKAYKEALKDFIDDIRKFASSRGAHFVSTASNEPVEKLLFKKLFETGTLQ